MVINMPPSDAIDIRKLGPVPWNNEGCRTLTVRARRDVPTLDDPMIRAALVRGASTCKRFVSLDRVLNRELWALGYVAHVERDLSDRSVVSVEVANGR